MKNEPQVLKWSLVNLQVCVPEEFTNEQAQDFANLEHPTGISSRWTVTKTKDPERVQCTERQGCVHIVMVC